MAIRLQKEGALLSVAKPLAEIKAVTISFWMRFPEPPPLEESPEAEPDGEQPAEKPPAEKPPPPVVPPTNLVSLKDYCDVRLEDGHVVANMDRTGEEARMALSQARWWHHILVENAEGMTTIWIDHARHSESIAETLAPVPAGGVVVEIGGNKADFFIDEVAIWNRKLTADERTVLYRRGRLDTPVIEPTKAIAHWGFDEKVGSRLFADESGDHALGTYKGWKPVDRIAPDPLPLLQKSNPSAAQLWHVTERPDTAGDFQINADAPFTYEGWVKLGVGSSALLGGTVSSSNEDNAKGWGLAVRPGKGVNGFLAFIYETGSERVQALAADLPLYDGLPHHFAAVWNPFSSPTHGTMEAYFDNRQVATASLALSDFSPDPGLPFRILARGTPIVLDELRFSSGALKPKAFLSGGLMGIAVAAGGPDPNRVADPPDKEESIMQRRDRELRERRAAKAAEHARKKAERAAAIERRRQEEKAKRKRNSPRGR